MIVTDKSAEDVLRAIEMARGLHGPNCTDEQIVSHLLKEAKMGRVSDEEIDRLAAKIKHNIRPYEDVGWSDDRPIFDALDELVRLAKGRSAATEGVQS